MKWWKNSWISRFIRYSNVPINKGFPWKLKRAMRLTKMSKFVAVVGDARLVRSRSIISQRVTKRKLRYHSRDKNFSVKFWGILRNFTLWQEMTHLKSEMIGHGPIRILIRICPAVHSMNDQEKSILVINGHLMSDNLSDNHPSRQTLYWTECSSFRRIINIFKNHKCSKMSENRFL